MDPQSHFEVALRSPAMVGAKDRAGWVGLFHADGFVEDPVEAGRYQGTPRIETFWDVFIGPQPSVRFEVARDFWCPGTLIRQATVVNITQADPHEPLRVPALIQYTLRDGRVGALQAVWEPPLVVAWFAGRGLAGIRALTKHSIRMMSRAGLRNGLSFGGTLVGGLGRDRARSLIEAIRTGDPQQWAERLGGATVIVGSAAQTQTFQADAPGALQAVQACAESVSRLAVAQLIVCGNHIAAFLTDQDGQGALAVMLHANGHGHVQTMTAIWSDAPRVLASADAATA